MEITPLGTRLTKIVLSGALDTPGVDHIEARFVAAVVPEHECCRRRVGTSNSSHRWASGCSSLWRGAWRSARQTRTLRPAVDGERGARKRFLERHHPCCRQRERRDCGCLVLTRRRGRPRGLHAMTRGTFYRSPERAPGSCGIRGPPADARQSELQPRARYNCELVFEEVVTNIIKHGYADDRDHHIEVCVAFPDEPIVLRFDDDAAPFDPLQHTTMIEPPARSTTSPLEGAGSCSCVMPPSASLRAHARPQEPPDRHDRCTRLV